MMSNPISEMPSPKLSARPDWTNDDIKNQGTNGIRKPTWCRNQKQTGLDVTGAEASQLSGTCRIADRITDDRPAGYINNKDYVITGPMSHAPIVIRSELSEPATSWADRLPERPYNGMPFPSSPLSPKTKRKKMALDTNTKQLTGPSDKEYAAHLKRMPLGTHTSNTKLPHNLVPQSIVDQMLAVSVMSTNCPSSPTSTGFPSSPHAREYGLYCSESDPEPMISPKNKSYLGCTSPHQLGLLGADSSRRRQEAGIPIIRSSLPYEAGRVAPHSHPDNPEFLHERPYEVRTKLGADAYTILRNPDVRLYTTAQQVSRQHSAEWGGSATVPALRLWAGNETPGSPTKSPVRERPEWTKKGARWHAQQIDHISYDATNLQLPPHKPWGTVA